MAERRERRTIHAAIDPHVHLREPGTNDSETIESGTRAARAGGYQAVFDMPNNPGAPTWSEERILEKQEIAAASSHVDIGFYAGIDLANPDIDQIPRMIGRAAGLKLYMGKTTGNNRIYSLDDAREVIDLWTDEAKARGLQAPIVLHAEGGIGAQTVGYIARRRKHHVHWAHLSTAYEAKEAEKFTKGQGEFFTSEATPHHLTMTDINARQLGWAGGRMMPSLKPEDDMEAITRAFADGYIQMVGTDHAPHSMDSKLAAERDNPHGHTSEGCTTCFGVSGIEFALPILMRSVELGRFSMERLEDALYDQPIRMLGLKASQLTAMTTLEIDPRRITSDDIVGDSENTPYVNMIAGARVVSMTGRHKKPRIFEAQQKAA
jgi:dihydroorotase